MKVDLHPHAVEAAKLRGATTEEVVRTIQEGEQFPAKHGRTGFRCNFMYNKDWQNKFYNNKQIIAYAVYENEGWLVITIIVKYY